MVYMHITIDFRNGIRRLRNRGKIQGQLGVEEDKFRSACELL